MPPPQMTILNAPPRESCIARRERTNTPLQALLLLNEPEYMKAARHLAVETLKQKLDDKGKINFAYERITSKVVQDSELKVLSKLIADTKQLYLADTKAAEDMCAGIKTDSLDQQIELATWTMLINTIYNLDITKTRE